MFYNSWSYKSPENCKYLNILYTAFGSQNFNLKIPEQGTDLQRFIIGRDRFCSLFYVKNANIAKIKMFRNKRWFTVYFMISDGNIQLDNHMQL